MKVRFVFPALIFSLVAFLFVPASYSQSNTGRILGTVHDQSGGGIADATITTLDVDRGIARTTVSDASGDYLVPNLTPGNYHVRAEAKGFKISERDKVLLEVGKDVNLEFVLVPGSITDVVTVTEEAPLLDTSSSTLGGTISNQTINDLPLNGRDFQNLVTLRPGVQRYPGGGFLSISSNGNRPEDNNFIVDGTDNNDPYYGTTVINAEGVQGTPATTCPLTPSRNLTPRKILPPNMAGSPAPSSTSV